jgi:hypothetical protein
MTYLGKLGAAVAAAVVLGASVPSHAATSLYAADNTSGGSSFVIALNAASLTENSFLVTTGAIDGLATNGTDIFASLPDGIAEYNLAGDLIGSYANLGNDHFDALSFANGTLYAADNTSGGSSFVIALNAASLTENSFFVTDGAIDGLATNGTDIFASLPDGIAKYNLAGDLIGSYPNLGNDHFDALALSPAAVPEPATWTVMLLGLGLIGARLRRRTRMAREILRFVGTE